ncbi:MAG: cobalamin-dependent protein [Chitinispirillaceae bacterium]|nr:cobalamin-dependent protein [Chitinispirillaceae bacterium]
MNELVETIGRCVERGKINKASPFPGDMKGLDGADELTHQALEAGTDAEAILQACIAAMVRIGEKFGRNEVFVPEMLMAAKAMKAVTEHLKPFFQSGSVQAKGTFIIGTVAGDLHDIGKNLVSMFVEGNGWNVVDLGVDVKPEKFIDAIRKQPKCVVGLSALLTTTIVSMSKTVQEIRALFPSINIVVGGAPLTMEIAKEMGANGYARDPQGAVRWLAAIREAS